MPPEIELSFNEVSGLIPHVRPFRFIDGATITEPGVRGRCPLTDLTRRPEFSYLDAHFPPIKINPGVIMVEAMAELLGTVALSGDQSLAGKIGLLATLDKWRFRKAVFPKDKAMLEAEVTRPGSRFIQGKVRAMLGESVAAEGKIGILALTREEFAALLQEREQEINENPTS